MHWNDFTYALISSTIGNLSLSTFCWLVVHFASSPIQIAFQDTFSLLHKKGGNETFIEAEIPIIEKLLSVHWKFLFTDCACLAKLCLLRGESLLFEGSGVDKIPLLWNMPWLIVSVKPLEICRLAVLASCRKLMHRFLAVWSDILVVKSAQVNWTYKLTYYLYPVMFVSNENFSEFGDKNYFSILKEKTPKKTSRKHISVFITVYHYFLSRMIYNGCIIDIFIIYKNFKGLWQ